MPEVLATGFMVGLVEWACIDAIAPHLDDGEMSLGVHVDLSHDAATPPGLEVAVRVRLEEVDGRRLTFAAEPTTAGTASAAGRHVRFIVDRARFDEGVARKRGRVPSPRRSCRPPGALFQRGLDRDGDVVPNRVRDGAPLAGRLGGLVEGGLVEARNVPVTVRRVRHLDAAALLRVDGHDGRHVQALRGFPAVASAWEKAIA